MRARGSDRISCGRTALQFLTVVALSVVAALPLLLPGFVDTYAYGDSPFVLLRLIELDQGIREGVWFPRWAPDFAYGYGYPFFNYYASLAYYLAEAFHLLGLGIVASAEAAFLVGFLLAGVGMYLFARDMFGGTAAVLVSAAYTYAPFHLVNVYLRGDALAEFFAYGLFPVILWAFRRLAIYRSIRYLVAAAASYGALMFTHNISALLFTGLLTAYVIVLLVTLAGASRGALGGETTRRLGPSHSEGSRPNWPSLRKDWRAHFAVAGWPSFPLPLRKGEGTTDLRAWTSFLRKEDESACPSSERTCQPLSAGGEWVASRPEPATRERTRALSQGESEQRGEPSGEVHANQAGLSTRREALASLCLVSFAAALGLALAAFFWVPALREQSYVQLEHMTTGYFDFHGHFLGLEQLVSPEWAYNYNLDGYPESGLPFHLGLIQTALALISLLVAILYWTRTRLRAGAAGERSTIPAQTGWHVAFFGIAFIFLAFLMSPYSVRVWEAVPLLPMVQFPWRLLSLASLSASLVCGFLVLPVLNRRRLTAVVLALALAAIAFSATLRLAPERMHLNEADLGPHRIFEYEYVTSSIGTTCRHEYLPRWVGDRPWSSATVASYPETSVPTVVDGGGAEVNVLEDRGYRKVLETDSAMDTAITLGSLYFPGWMAKIDGQDAGVGAAAGSGLMSVAVPSGNHRVEISFGTTRVRELASTASMVAIGILGLLILLGVGIRKRGSRIGAPAPGRWPPVPGPWEAGLPVVVVAALAGVWLGLQSGLPAEQGGAVPANLHTRSADIHSPLAHDHPNGIQLSDGWCFQGYEMSSWKVAPPGKINLKLHWEAEQSAPEGARAIARLVSPANLVLQRGWSHGESAVAAVKPIGSAGAHQSEHEIAVAEATPPGLYFVEVVLEHQGRATSILGPFGQPTDRKPLLGPFVVQRGEAAIDPGGESVTRLAEFGGVMALVSEQLHPAHDADGGVTVSLEWLALKKMPISYRASLRLVDGAERVWGFSDGQMADGLYPTNLWNTGERVRDLREVTPLPGTPPGEYYVELRVYQPSDNQTLEVVDAQQRVSAMVRLGPVKLSRVQRPAVVGDWQLSSRLEMKCPDGLGLVGYTLQNEQVQEGEDLLLTLGWLAQSRLTMDHAVSVQLVDGQGAVKAESRMPLSPSYPSSSWEPGDFVRGQYALRVPPGVESGDYRVRLGIVGHSDCSPVDTWLPGKVTVKARARQFDAPATANPVDVNFSNIGRLVGYDVDDGVARPGGAIGLTLYWRALERTEKSYKVFTHLVGADGRIYGQKDDFPAQGTKPTSSWLKGEYVEDTYTIPIDPGASTGDYRLLVGLYDLGSGQRLPVVDEGGKILGDHTVLTELRLE